MGTLDKQSFAQFLKTKINSLALHFRDLKVSITFDNQKAKPTIFSTSFKQQKSKAKTPLL